MRLFRILLIIAALVFCTRVSMSLDGVTAQPESPPEDPTSVEAYERAEKQYVAGCRADGMVEHNGIYVPESWHEKYGDLTYSALAFGQSRSKEEYIRDKSRKIRGMKKKLVQSKVAFYSRKFASNDPEKALDVMIVGDGFTKKTMAKFSRYAATVPGALLKSVPYGMFKSVFNFHIVGAVSPQSGITTKEKKVNTIFGTVIRPERGNILYTRNVAMVKHYAGLISPPAELVIVVANSFARARETGSVGMTPGIITVKLNTSINRVVRHELGHAFGGLADEYVEFKGPKKKPTVEPREPNVTIERNPEKCKWNYWYKATGGRVRTYEGANYYSKFYYRPEKQCLMRSGDRFCSVCMEVMMMKCFRAVDIVRRITPLSAHVVLGRHDKHTFSFDAHRVAGGTATGVWLVDGKPVGRGQRFFLSASNLKPGRHIVTLAFRHLNKHVLRGEEFLGRTFFWDVEVLPCAKPKMDFPRYVLKVKAGELLEMPVINRTPPPKQESEKYALNIECTNLPEGAVFNVDEMKFLWRPRTYQRGAHVLQFKVTVGGKSELHRVRINVLDPKQRAGNRPVILFISDQEVSEGAKLSFKIEAVDLDYDSVAITTDTLPEGAYFDPLTGEFVWVPGFFQGRDEEYEVRFNATDGAGRSTAAVVGIFVRDNRGERNAFYLFMQVVEKGQKGRARDVEYGLVSSNSTLRIIALKFLREYYGNAVLVDCLRLMKSKDAVISTAAASLAAKIFSDDVGGKDAALVKYCIERIKYDFGELRAISGNLDRVLDAIEKNEDLPADIRDFAQVLLKKK